MKNHLYFYCSNLDQTSHLHDYPDIKAVWQYSSHEMRKTFQNEYGRIQTSQNYYHLLVGRMPQEGCPWCGSPCQIIHLENINADPIPSLMTKYCIQCMQCGSRGPVLNINHPNLHPKEIMEEYKEILWQRFNNRRPWDDGFVNPYENGTVT